MEMKNATPLTPLANEWNSIFKCKQCTDYDPITRKIKLHNDEVWGNIYTFKMNEHNIFHKVIQLYLVPSLEVVTQREDDQTFAGKRQLVSFLSWLDYCDQLSSVANPIVAEALAAHIHQHFLRPCVLPDLTQM